MQRSHAIANGVYIAAINRTGTEKISGRKIQFWGNSMIINPSGKVIGRLGDKKEGILIREIDYDKIDTIRGLDIAITTSAKTDDQGRALLSAFNFPFRT